MKVFPVLAVILVFASQSFAQSFSFNMMTYRYSLHNKKGKTICAECYLEVRPFKDGKAWVKDTVEDYHKTEYTNRGLNDYPAYEYTKWGMIDKKGKWVIKPTYDKLDTFINGVALVGKYQFKYSWYNVSPEGTFSIDSFKGIEKDSNNYRYLRQYDYITIWGIVSEKGKEIIPIKYPELYRYVNGYALAGLGIFKKPDTGTLYKLPSYHNTLNDTQTRYILFDANGNIYKRLYHQDIIPQYTSTSSENYSNSMEGNTTTFNYTKVPPFYYYMDINDGAEYYGLLDSRGNELIPPYTFVEKHEVVGAVLDDANDPYNMHDTALVVYKRPPFFYDSISRQLFYKFLNEKENTNRSIIAKDNGTILYKSSNIDFFTSFPSNNTYIDFVRQNGNYEIHFPYPISEKYDTVSNYFVQFNSFPNRDINAFVQRDSDSPYNNITHNIYITHRDSLYGLINKNLKEIIPLKYADQSQRMDDEYISNPMYLYLPPTLLYIKQANQYIYSGKNISTGQWEAFIISGEGEIVTNIIDCLNIKWDTDKSIYAITLSGGINKLCDTKGIIK